MFSIAPLFSLEIIPLKVAREFQCELQECGNAITTLPKGGTLWDLMNIAGPLLLIFAER